MFTIHTLQSIDYMYMYYVICTDMNTYTYLCTMHFTIHKHILIACKQKKLLLQRQHPLVPSKLSLQGTFVLMIEIMTFF
jgi:hypothetical protein